MEQEKKAYTKEEFLEVVKNHEEIANKIRKENQVHLDGFEAWLTAKGLAKKTIKNHLQNVDFYINEYLVRYEPVGAAKGCGFHVEGFLGDWFIRKTTWASRAEIKANAASFKKFYAFMLEKNEIEQNDFDALIAMIKEGLPEWLEKIDEYDSMEFDW